MAADVDWFTRGLAIYGAVVATLSGVAGWWMWRRSRATVVRIDFFPDQAWTEQRYAWRAVARVVNLSDHSVRVESVWIDATPPGANHLIGWWFDPPPAGATLPGTVLPHDAGTTLVLIDELRKLDLDPSEPITVRVRLSTGRVFMSDGSPLWPRVANG